MEFNGYGNEPPPDAEAAIDELLGENPRARELREMRQVLEARREGMKREKRDAKDAREAAQWEAKMEEAARQIEILRNEEAITEFVENSVRVTLLQPSVDEIGEY